MNRGGFQLRKWNSNSKPVRESIKVQENSSANEMNQVKQEVDFCDNDGIMQVKADTSNGRDTVTRSTFGEKKVFTANFAPSGENSVDQVFKNSYCRSRSTAEQLNFNRINYFVSGCIFRNSKNFYRLDDVNVSVRSKRSVSLIL